MKSNMIKTAKRAAHAVINNTINCVGNITKHFEKNPFFLCRLDGGVASQIYRVGMGLLFQNKGYNVKFDRVDSKIDMLGVERRDYEIEEMFPELPLSFATRAEARRYNRLYRCSLHGWDRKYRDNIFQLKVPFAHIYELDQFISIEDIVKYIPWEDIKDKLGTIGLKYLHQMEENHSRGMKNVGVHVRRGDMAVSAPGGYWKILTKDYFAEAMRHLPPNSHLFIITHDLPWAKENVATQTDLPITFVKGQEKDYQDLYLLSKCDIQVASQGSWGGFAFAFNTNPAKRLICYEGYFDISKAPSSGQVIYIPLTDSMYSNH